MAEVTMPRLSDTMSEGSVGRWLKKPGDSVTDGEVIAEIETDKATMDLVAFESGTLQKILIPEGQTVEIGVPIAIIGDGPAPAEVTPAPAATPAPVAPAATVPVATPAAVVPATTASSNGHSNDEHVKASPLARRLAAERGIDLRQVHGTGPGGRIIKENVEEFQPVVAATAAPAPVAQPAPNARPTPSVVAAGEAVVPMSRMRRSIARAMTDSQPGTPHIYVTIEIDMGAAMQLRKQINDSGAADAKVSVNDMVVKAAAKALRKFPSLNSSYAIGSDNQPGVVQHEHINVSIAVAIDEGLVAPVIRDADTKTIGTIAANAKDLASRAREGKLKQNDLEAATFQVSNLGMYNIVEFTSIIPVPLAASLAVGAVRQTPVVRNGELAIGEMMYVTLSTDHRVADGATAAQYLQELRHLLETPMGLLV